MKLDLDSAIAAMIVAKRDEYLRLVDVGQCPLGKYSSMPKVVDYAMQLLTWIDNNRGDDSVESVLARFAYTPSVGSPGRPSTNRGALNAIKPKQMLIIMNMLRAQGITEPSDEQILDVFNNAKLVGEPIGGDAKKAARANRKKIGKVMMDKDSQKLDDETRKMIGKKPVDRQVGDPTKLEVMDREEGIRALFGDES